MMNRLKKKLLVSLVVITAALNAVPASASDLDDAKRAGQVGEQANGYLGLVQSSAPSAIQRLVQDVNQKRRAEYQRIAEKNGITLSQVEALAGKKAVDKTSSGGWVKINGAWQQK